MRATAVWGERSERGRAPLRHVTSRYRLAKRKNESDCFLEASPVRQRMFVRSAHRQRKDLVCTGGSQQQNLAGLRPDSQ